MKTSCRRGCRGKASKRRHREAWLRRIGAAWAVAHQDGAAKGAVKDIGKYYDEKRSGQSSCSAVAKKSLGDVHREDVGGGGQRPRQKAGDRDSPGRVTAHSDVSVADGGLGLGPLGAAVAAAVEVSGIAEEKTHPGGGALGLGGVLSAKFSELDSAIAGMHNAVLGVAAHVESLTLADLAVAECSSEEASRLGDGAAHQADAAHQKEEKVAGAAHQVDAAHHAKGARNATHQVEVVLSEGSGAAVVLSEGSGAAVVSGEGNDHRFRWCACHKWWWLWLGLSVACLSTRPVDVALSVAIPIAVVGAGMLTGAARVLLLVASQWRRYWWLLLWSLAALFANCSGIGFLIGAAVSAAVVQFGVVKMEKVTEVQTSRLGLSSKTARASLLKKLQSGRSRSRLGVCR